MLAWWLGSFAEGRKGTAREQFCNGSQQSPENWIAGQRQRRSLQIRQRALWAVSVFIVLARSARVCLQVFGLLSLPGFGLPGDRFDLGTGMQGLA